MSHFFYIMLTLVVVLLGVGYAAAITHTVSKKVDELPGGPYDSKKVIDQIKETQSVLRNEIELGRMQTSSTGDELRHQGTIHKDRLQWLLLQYDALRDSIEKHAQGASPVGKAAVESSDVADG